MKIKEIVLFSVILILVSRCDYEKEKTLPVPTNVSFNANVLPLFNASCNKVGCHSAGGQTPDLTAANAYTSLLDGGYVDTTLTVEQSELYKRMIDRQKPMPPNGVLSQNDINIIYSWIQAKAPNN